MLLRFVVLKKDCDSHRLQGLFQAASRPSHSASLEKWRQTLITELASRPEGFSDGQSLIPNRPVSPLLPT